jgi:integrase
MKGHIRPRGPGAWELKFDVPSENGERKTRYVTVRGGKRDAQHELTRLLNEVEHGKVIDRSAETIAGYLDRWGRDWVAADVSRRAGERYRELMTTHVVPRLADDNARRLWTPVLEHGR